MPSSFQIQHRFVSTSSSHVHQFSNPEASFGDVDDLSIICLHFSNMIPHLNSFILYILWENILIFTEFLMSSNKTYIYKYHYLHFLGWSCLRLYIDWSHVIICCSRTEFAIQDYFSTQYVNLTLWINLLQKWLTLPFL